MSVSQTTTTRNAATSPNEEVSPIGTFESREEAQSFYANRAQDAALEKAVSDAREGKLGLLIDLISNKSAEARTKGIKSYNEYRLWKGQDDTLPRGVRTPEWRQYERVQTHEKVQQTAKSATVLHYDRYIGCPYQDYCDRVNDAARDFGLIGRLVSKHHAIFQNLVNALDAEEIRWVPVPGGGWETSAFPEKPTVVMSASDFDGPAVPALADRRPMPSKIEHLYTEGLR